MDRLGERDRKSEKQINTQPTAHVEHRAILFTIILLLHTLTTTTIRYYDVLSEFVFLFFVFFCSDSLRWWCDELFAPELNSVRKKTHTSKLQFSFRSVHQMQLCATGNVLVHGRRLNRAKGNSECIFDSWHGLRQSAFMPTKSPNSEFFFFWGWRARTMDPFFVCFFATSNNNVLLFLIGAFRSYSAALYSITSMLSNAAKIQWFVFSARFYFAENSTARSIVDALADNNHTAPSGSVNRPT